MLLERLERASLQFSLFVHTLAVILYAVVRRAEVVKLRGLDGLELASLACVNCGSGIATVTGPQLALRHSLAKWT